MRGSGTGQARTRGPRASGTQAPASTDAGGVSTLTAGRREGRGGPAPGDAAKGAREKRRDDACNVQRGREELQELVVVLLFVVFWR